MNPTHDFGLFILRAGVWTAHATDETLSSFLKQERAYLADSLGLTVAIFRKIEA
ncbi:histidine decarboxylase, pyruvoyl type [Mesorhizobium sp. C280B]|uniref:hypothetical protein n=1 Tax=unclassified Mesorhizobium TaxID=325217 RepID=UPI0003CE9C72|nr:hypothetical protein [Mesorhizobium sp. LSJC280B00]ESW92932.1 hypothetical protein X772_02980 [Mesorhizobium sp. LSJC280B00]